MGGVSLRAGWLWWVGCLRVTENKPESLVSQQRRYDALWESRRRRDWSQPPLWPKTADLKFMVLGISRRTAWQLIRSGLWEVDEVATFSDDLLFCLRNVGKRSVEEIRGAIPYRPFFGPPPTEDHYDALLVRLPAYS